MNEHPGYNLRWVKRWVEVSPHSAIHEIPELQEETVLQEIRKISVMLNSDEHAEEVYRWIWHDVPVEEE